MFDRIGSWLLGLCLFWLHEHTVVIKRAIALYYNNCLIYRLRVMVDLCDIRSSICRALTQHRQTFLMLK